MNREIKFRAWDEKLLKFHFFNDIFNEKPFTETSSFPQYESCPLYHNCVVQQFTGLKDKNGKEIYEGDIITFTKRGITHGPDAEDVKNAEVWYSFEDCSFVFGKYKSADYTWWYSMADDLRDFEVVGNIFENHNLLDNTIKI